MLRLSSPVTTTRLASIQGEILSSWCSREYCQSARSRVRMSSFARAAVVRQNRTYVHHRSNGYGGVDLRETDQSAPVDP